MRISSLYIAAALGLLAPAMPFAFAQAAEPARSQQAALTPDQQQTLGSVENYLNRIDSLEARFIQLSSNGQVAEGKLYLDRPGRLRFDYDPPHPALLIANGVTLLYYDRDVKQASFYPLSRTPLWFFVREQVRFNDSGLRVESVKRADGALGITLRDEKSEDRAAVTLYFTERPLELKRWEITDPQGITTQVSLVNPQFGVAVDSKLFDSSDLPYDRGFSNVPSR